MSKQFYFVQGIKRPTSVSRDQFADGWPYRTKSPEWFAARQSHNIACLAPDSWLDYPELHRWLKRVVEVIEDREMLASCRRTELTEEERDAVAAEEADIEENGF